MSITTPALASAKIGTITKLVHGCSSSWRRSFGETARSTDSFAERASSGSGDWPNARASAPARSTSSCRGGYAETSRPTTTPPSVGCTPEAVIATHSAAPTMKYAGPRHTRSRPRARIARMHTAAAASAGSEMSSE